MKAFLFWAATSCLTVISSSGAAADSMLKLVATIALPDVKGRIDHLSVDVAGRRLLVDALGNDTVEVVDLENNRHQRTLRGFGEPQGVLHIAATNRLYVANGAANRLDILDASTFEIRKRSAADDADNLRLDKVAGMAIVGYGRGALRMIDIASEEASAEVRLPAHPESFQLEHDGTRIFVNVPDARQVAVVDRTRHVVVAAWQTPGAAANFPMPQ